MVKETLPVCAALEMEKMVARPGHCSSPGASSENSASGLPCQPLESPSVTALIF